MKKLAFLLLLAALGNPAGAQQPGKIKVKTKPGKNAAPAADAPAAPAPGTPADAPPPTKQAPVEADWALHYATTYITQEKLRRDLSVLASDEYEGRETGEKGQKMAADYLSKQFAGYGLTGPVAANAANTYLQPFGLERSAWQKGATLTVGAKKYQWLTDFYAFGVSPFNTETAVQPVFAGYGIEQGDYSDYAGRDVKGKDLLVLLGEPLTPEGKAVLSPDGNPTKWGADFRAKAALAAQKGARSVFFVDFNPRSNFAKLAARLAPAVERPVVAFAGQAPERAPSFFVSPAVGLQLLGTTDAAVQKYRAAAATAKKPVASPFKVAKFKVNAPQQRTPFTTENVLGYLPGTDKKDEVLVVSAHYDHLGVIGGQVYNGADDDGSGTSSVLALAEAFGQAAKQGHGPRRSILFLANTGEEKGLLGSEYYAEHPVFPLANTIADLNVDMVGRTDDAHQGKPDYVYVIGSDKLSSELHAINEAANKKYTQLDLDYRYNDPDDPNRFYYRSDHYNFAVHKIPVAFYFNGVHADYHEASDEVSKIEFDKMEKRARLVFYTAWELANREGRIVVDSNKP